MKWLLRFLAWATLLAVPGFWLADAYHRLLARAAFGLLGITADPSRMQAPDVPASSALGVYAALCLASTRVPLARRLTAIAIGLAALVALEIAIGTLAIQWAVEELAGETPVPASIERLRDNLTALPAWIAAPALWLALLGRWELPRAAGERRPAPIKARGPGGRASPRAG